MRNGILAAAVLLTGCAVNHYGRELPVIPAERSAYDCPAIALEIAKCDAFTQGVYDTWHDTKGRRIFAGFVDLGIGDHREKSEALDSAEARRAELVSLGAAKGCPAPPPAPVED
jgi:hypothetical protein